MPDSLRVVQEDTSRDDQRVGGRLLLVAPPQDKVLGELVYRWVDDVMHIDHAEVAVRLRGKGLARLLVLDAIRRARDGDFRLRPHCSYVRSVLDGLGSAVNDVLA